MRQCSKCKLIKGLDQFHKTKANASGYHNQCINCRKLDRKPPIKKPRKPRLKTKSRRQINQEYYAANREKLLADMRQYQIDNRAIVNANSARYHASKLNATPEWLTPEQLDDIRVYYEVCAFLSAEWEFPFHVDHVVPLQGENVSGLHVAWNLQLLPATENIAKSNNHAIA